MPPAVRTSAAMTTLTPTLASAWTSAIADELLRRSQQRVDTGGDDRLLRRAVGLQVLVPAGVEAGGDVQPVARAVDRMRVGVQRHRRQDEHPVGVCHQRFFFFLAGSRDSFVPRSLLRASAGEKPGMSPPAAAPNRRACALETGGVYFLPPGISCRPVASRR